MFAAADTALADLIYIEAFPTSPLDPEPVHGRTTDSAGDETGVRRTDYSSWAHPPGPGLGQQNGSPRRKSLFNERHQIWTSDIGSPDPIVYKIDHQVSGTSFTTSKVLPIT